jgi:hypothetical protein
MTSTPGKDKQLTKCTLNFTLSQYKAKQQASITPHQQKPIELIQNNLKIHIFL